MKWQDKALGDCATFQSGGTPNKGRSEYWSGDIPWVSSGEMTRPFITDTSLHITEAGAASGSRLVPAGTIFAVVRGMSLASEFRVAYATRQVAFNQDLKALTAREGIDSYFLFSALRVHGPAIRDLATEAAHGTKKLEMERLESFRIRIPDFDTQVRIAAEARNFDELIESNLRRIALLEESSRLLYREWFVNLRFPGHELAPMHEGLPEGWRLGRLDEALLLQRGFDLPTQARKPGEIPIYSSTGITAYHDEARARGPGVVTGRSGTLGVVHHVHGDYWPLNTALWVKEFRAVTPIVAYFMLSEMNLAQYNSGASVPTLDRKVAHAQAVFLPPSTVINQLEDIIEPVFEQTRALRRSISGLQEARNALLPKIMSGEISV